MKKILIILINIFILAVLTTGCLSIQTDINPASLEKDKDIGEYGYIFGVYSRGFMGIRITPPDLQFHTAKFENNGKRIKKTNYCAAMSTSGNEEDIFLFKVQPGSYTIYKTMVENYYTNRNINFFVEKGKVYYIGNFKIRYRVKEYDNFYADKQLLHIKVPKLSEYSIVNTRR